ncbi:MAG: lysophospholipid acyltransferase family protein [Myxococcales bacterium]|nr:lysophospholipid acyltransferase family protein [Myxococcales bacterium]MDD9972100.1 lysophospholipid acyltransferase family protein [Myxococcales bacterium]
MTLLEQTRGSVRAAVLIGMTACMLFASEVHRRMLGGEAGEQAFARWRSAWAQGLLRTFGVRVTLRGQRPREPTGARLVIANHRSPLDILISLELTGGTVLSRADLAGWPVLGKAAQAADTIFVDRADPRSGLAAIRAMRARLKRKGTVILFPEGGTFEGDEVRAFSAGAFAAARGLDVEVVPIGFAYEPGCEFVHEGFREYLMRMSGRPNVRVAAAIGRPQRLVTKRSQAAVALQGEVQALVDQARQALNQHGPPKGDTA